MLKSVDMFVSVVICNSLAGEELNTVGTELMQKLVTRTRRVILSKSVDVCL